MSNTEPEVRAGQLWREVDPRIVRIVEVLRVYSDAAMIRKLGVKSGNGRRAALVRFNGKRGGYRYVADRKVCSQCGVAFSPAGSVCGLTHAAIQMAMQ